MGKFEVTNGQYCEFLNAALGSETIVPGNPVFNRSNGKPYCAINTATSQIAFDGATFSVCYKGGRDMSNDPMVMVTWYGAAAYCNWRSEQEGKEPCYYLSTWMRDVGKKGYRLPTEAEWEYAARGSLAGERFPWGETISHSQANYISYDLPFDVSPTRGYHPAYYDGIEPYTCPAGRFAPNDYGLYDMAGNAYEWCHDWYSDYSPVPQTNPIGPATGSDRVLRGGSWNFGPLRCRVAMRERLQPMTMIHHIGFRLALDY